MDIINILNLLLMKRKHLEGLRLETIFMISLYLKTTVHFMSWEYINYRISGNSRNLETRNFHVPKLHCSGPNQLKATIIHIIELKNMLNQTKTILKLSLYVRENIICFINGHFYLWIGVQGTLVVPNCWDVGT